MNVSEQIINVLDNLCQKFGLVIDWTSDNIVPYLTTLCTRVCTYEIATSILWIVMIIIMLIGTIIYHKHSWKNPINWDTYDITAKQLNGITSTILIVVMTIVGITVIITQSLDITEAICLPELTMIDYIKGLTNIISN